MLKKSSIELLRRVKAHILEEPKRINMTIWLRRKDDGSFGQPPKSWPKCETVGCIGGWVEVLSALEKGGKAFGDGRTAREILGISDMQADELFFDKNVMGGRMQTTSHAREVARHIDNFIRRHSRKRRVNR